jgi:hypothetical protein
MDKLREFHADKPMMEAVYNHVAEYLKAYALLKVFAGKDTSAIPEAKTILEQSFDQLEELYGEKTKPKINSSR